MKIFWESLGVNFCFAASFIRAWELSGPPHTSRSVRECVCVYGSVFIRKLGGAAAVCCSRPSGGSKPGRAGLLFSVYECVCVQLINVDADSRFYNKRMFVCVCVSVFM